MQLKINKPIIYIFVSLIIYIISLTQPAISSNELNDKTLSGIATLVMGGLSVLGGGFFEWIIWLANPLYFLSIIFFIKYRNTAQVLSLLSCILALSFVTWDKVLASESGRLAKIESLDIGYWLWLSSIVILTIGIFLSEENPKK